MHSLYFFNCQIITTDFIFCQEWIFNVLIFLSVILSCKVMFSHNNGDFEFDDDIKINEENNIKKEKKKYY